MALLIRAAFLAVVMAAGAYFASAVISEGYKATVTYDRLIQALR